ncbi:hypothetical protein HOY82DRAFT_495545, partial [Tuber indicum]
MRTFLELILILIHLTCGQPARGTELLSSQIANTHTHYRNLIIVEGQLSLLTKYNKTQSLLGKDNIILRTLPPCVSTLLI